MLGFLGTGLPPALAAIDVVANIAIPISIGIAVLRYKLYNIDVVIDRTLVYGLLTATSRRHMPGWSCCSSSG